MATVDELLDRVRPISSPWRAGAPGFGRSPLPASASDSLPPAYRALMQALGPGEGFRDRARSKFSCGLLTKSWKDEGWTVSDHEGERLLQELLADPARFEKSGEASKLLKAYFRGFPLDTLRDLLASDDRGVQRNAAFIVSELGEQAQPLLDDVVPLIYSGSRYMAYQALESVLLCAVGGRADRFAHVMQALESDDAVIRALAMRLASRATVEQLAAASRVFSAERSGHKGHAAGLSVLLEGPRVAHESVVRMLEAPTPLERKYGAIAVGRSFGGAPELVQMVGASDDGEVRALARELTRG